MSSPRDQVRGVLYALTVVGLWCSSCFLTQWLFIDVGFDKPVFTSLTQMSLATVLLFPSWFRSTHMEESDEEGSQGGPPPPVDPVPHVPIKIARLALYLGPFWLVGEILYNLALDKISVPTATIISALSPIVVILLSAIVLHDKLKGLTVMAAFIGLFGMWFISLEGAQGGHVSDSILGIVQCIFSIFCYAIFSVGVKYGLDDDDDSSTLFGYMGLLSLILLPLVTSVTHMTGFEVYTLGLDLKVAVTILINAYVGAILSGVLLTRATVLLKPVVATSITALNIPASVYVDMKLLQNHTFSRKYFFGCGLVVASTIMTTMDHREPQERARLLDCEQGLVVTKSRD